MFRLVDSQKNSYYNQEFKMKDSKLLDKIILSDMNLQLM